MYSLQHGTEETIDLTWSPRPALWNYSLSPTWGCLVKSGSYRMVLIAQRFAENMTVRITEVTEDEAPQSNSTSVPKQNCLFFLQLSRWGQEWVSMYFYPDSAYAFQWYMPMPPFREKEVFIPHNTPINLSLRFWPYWTPFRFQKVTKRTILTFLWITTSDQ